LGADERGMPPEVHNLRGKRAHPAIGQTNALRAANGKMASASSARVGQIKVTTQWPGYFSWMLWELSRIGTTAAGRGRFSFRILVLALSTLPFHASGIHNQ